MWMKPLCVAVLIATTAPLLSGCAGALLGAGATVGIAAYEERGIEGAARDTKTATEIRLKYLNENAEITTNVGIEVYESRALLTGLVTTEYQRAIAVKLAWSVSDVKDVINEIQLRKEEGIVDFAYDSWITAQLKTKLAFDENVMAINYTLETVNAVIYLIGIAQNKPELDRVIEQAHSIDRVRRVISHVRVMEPKPES